MLKALYDYGIRRRLALPPGCVGKTIKAYISLSESEDSVSVYLGDEEPVPCPDIGSLANGKDKSNVLAEKRSVVIPTQPGSKSAFFLKALRSASEAEPLLKPCVHALETPEIAAAIQAELDRAKVNPGDRISFRVNGQSILRSEKVRAWWQSFRRQFSKGDEEPSALCLITGKPTVPMTTTTPIQGLRVVGGHASGDALICFDKSAFCSYNQKKAANAPVSEEAFCVVKAALDDLLKDAPILAGMKFVHWFDREIPQEDDPLCSIDFGYGSPEEDPPEDASAINEQTVRSRANQVPESFYSGQSVSGLDNVSYYILLLSGANSRIMIRKYDRGNYADLRRSLEQWYSDLALTNQGGTGNTRPVKLTARLLRLLKFQTTDKRPFERLSKELAGITPAVVQAILTGGILPDAVASKALAYIRSELLASDDGDTQRKAEGMAASEKSNSSSGGTDLGRIQSEPFQRRLSLRRTNGRLCGNSKGRHARCQHRDRGAVLCLRNPNARSGHWPAQQPFQSSSGKNGKHLACQAVPGKAATDLRCSGFLRSRHLESGAAVLFCPGLLPNGRHAQQGKECTHCRRQGKGGSG